MIPELLSPAGSPEKLEYALAYGADALYAGIPKFSLRTRENPFKDRTLRNAIDLVHSKKKKIFLTANILPPNRKIQSFQKSLANYADAGVDAFIMSDPGMIKFARTEFPHIPIHLSVQTNTMNWSSAAFWYDEGVKRIILSRELSLNEIQEIHYKVPDLELEAFVHGSICIAYSGRCLLSNYFNHRDANQGTCTNSCRWEYKVYQEDTSQEMGCDSIKEGKEFYIEEHNRPGVLMPIEEDEHGTYIMNSKDLRAIEFLQDLKNSGVISFKIEGRTKSIYYLCLTTLAYRKAIDDLDSGQGFNSSLINQLDKTSNRGFTSAFLVNTINQQTERFNSPQNNDLPQVYAGQIKGEKSGDWVEVDIKNRIEVGDELEYISPKRQYRFSLQTMENPNGSAIDIAHGGNGSVWMKTNGPVEPYSLLSRIQNPATEKAFD